MELLKEFLDAGWRVTRYTKLDNLYYLVKLQKPIPFTQNGIRYLVIEDLTYEKKCSDFDPNLPWNVGDWAVQSYSIIQNNVKYQCGITLSEMKMILRLIEAVEENKW